jgi:hypothetical protein
VSHERGPFSDQALVPRRKLRVGSSAPFRRRSRPSHVHVRDGKRLGEVSRVLLASGLAFPARLSVEASLRVDGVAQPRCRPGLQLHPARLFGAPELNSFAVL